MPASLFDLNVWLAIALPAHPLHVAADAAFRAQSGAEPAYFCRATQQGFLRLMTTQNFIKHYGIPLPTNHDAWAMIDQIMSLPAVGFTPEPVGVWPRWRTFSDLNTASPKRWMDAYLAAFAIEAGLQFVTNDGAFATFAGLNVLII